AFGTKARALLSQCSGKASRFFRPPLHLAGRQPGAPQGLGDGGAFLLARLPAPFGLPQFTGVAFGKFCGPGSPELLAIRPPLVARAREARLLLGSPRGALRGKAASRICVRGHRGGATDRTRKRWRLAVYIAILIVGAQPAQPGL